MAGSDAPPIDRALRWVGDGARFGAYAAVAGILIGMVVIAVKGRDVEELDEH